MILEIFSNHGGSMILWLFGHRLSILGSALWSQGLDSMILGDHYRISFQLRIFYYIFFYFCILTNKYSTWQSHRLSIARASCISPQTSKELERGWRKAESLKLLEHPKQWRFAFVHTQGLEIGIAECKSCKQICAFSELWRGPLSSMYSQITLLTSWTSFPSSLSSSSVK